MRRGFVLVAVLFALVLLASLAAAGFFESLQELRIGRTIQQDLLLRTAAESGLIVTLADWDPRNNAALESGVELTLPGPAPAGLLAGVSVSRLSDRLLLLRSSATDQFGTTRVVEQVSRLVGPETSPAAVRARAVDAIVTARADGTDRSPALWTCPDSSGGAPGVKLEPGASDSEFFSFGTMDWAALVAWARAVPAGGDSLPVVYQHGDTTVSGQRWLGTLVVDGDLVLRGGAQVVGLLFVRGRLVIGAGGATVQGSVVASQVTVNNEVTPQELGFGYSSCSALRAALSRALPGPLSWLPAWGVY